MLEVSVTYLSALDVAPVRSMYETAVWIGVTGSEAPQTRQMPFSSKSWPSAGT